MIIKEKISELEEGIIRNQDKIKKLKELQKTQESINKNFNEVISLLKVLIPEHSRTSCSDKKPDNVDGCNRCTVLGMESDGFWNDDYTLDISIERLG